MSDDIRLVTLRGTTDPVTGAAPADETTANTPALPQMDDSRTDLEALKDGAAMLSQAGNRVAALALLWSAVALDPRDLGAHRRLAATLAHGGEIDGAAEEYARYIEFMLPLGEVGRATLELTYGAKMLGGHPALHAAAQKIATAVLAIVPAAPRATVLLPAPRLLPKVPFRFCVHDDGNLHWMQLEGGTADLVPAAVRLLDRDDNVVETRRCIPIAAGQKGHARIVGDEQPGVAWVVVGIPDEVVAALDAGKPSPYRFEAKVGDEWISTALADTGCRLGRIRPKVAVS